MRKFRIKESADVEGLDGHEVGGIYELYEIDADGDYWLKVDNKHVAWAYSPEDIEEVFEDEKHMTLRDKFAMSLPAELMPKLQNDATAQYFAKKYGLTWSDDVQEQVKFAFDLEAIFRYQYADSMLERRKLNKEVKND